MPKYQKLINFFYVHFDFFFFQKKANPHRIRPIISHLAQGLIFVKMKTKKLKIATIFLALTAV